MSDKYKDIREGIVGNVMQGLHRVGVNNLKDQKSETNINVLRKSMDRLKKKNLPKINKEETQPKKTLKRKMQIQNKIIDEEKQALFEKVKKVLKNNKKEDKKNPLVNFNPQTIDKVEPDSKGY